jgi:hypothetical protein
VKVAWNVPKGKSYDRRDATTNAASDRSFGESLAPTNRDAEKLQNEKTADVVMKPVGDALNVDSADTMRSPSQQSDSGLSGKDRLHKLPVRSFVGDCDMSDSPSASLENDSRQAMRQNRSSSSPPFPVAFSHLYSLFSLA